jgi:SOS-response transcriptional repressor LexA
MALTKKQKEVLDYITEYVRENGYSPTQKEIQDQRLQWNASRFYPIGSDDWYLAEL